MNNRDVIKVLVSARARVRAGWCQHRFSIWENGTAKFCSSGAILHYDIFSSVSAVSYAMSAFGRTIWGNITYWNDLPGRTQKDVLDAFNVTIERLERSQ